MRPIAHGRNALRYPLNDVFGTEAHVRILRALIHEGDGPLGAADAAKLTGLTQPGARKALHRLQELGVVRSVGAGRSQKYGLRRQEGMVDLLRSLFDAEQRLYDDLLAGLRQAFAGVHEVQLAWIRDLPVRLGDPVELVVVADVRATPWLGEELRTRIAGVEKEYDLTVEISLFTQADAPAAEPDALFVLVNEPVGGLGSRKRPKSHREADELSLQLAGAVSELIRSDPSLIRRAVQHLNRLAHDPQGIAVGDVLEWRQVLETYSPERVSKLLVSGSSRARRLRQSSPFLAVLSPEERDRLTALLLEKAR